MGKSSKTKKRSPPTFSHTVMKRGDKAIVRDLNELDISKPSETSNNYWKMCLGMDYKMSASDRILANSDFKRFSQHANARRVSAAIAGRMDASIRVQLSDLLTRSVFIMRNGKRSTIKTSDVKFAATK